MGHLFRGNATEAISPLEHGLTLNPNDPQNFVWLNLLSLAHLFAGAADKALVAAIRGRKVRPGWRPIYETLTCCYVALGQYRDAGECRAEMAQLEPSGDALGPLRLRNPAWAEQLAKWVSHVP
jgi:tetratricopeptide (TPR) repeat protein